MARKPDCIEPLLARALAVRMPAWATHVAVSFAHDRAEPVRLTGGIFGRHYYDEHGLVAYATNHWEFYGRAELNRRAPREVGPPIELRRLRLWHWKCLAKARQVKDDTAANFHLGAVQTLNEHFPIGDTAEQDEERAKAQSRSVFAHRRRLPLTTPWIDI